MGADPSKLWPVLQLHSLGGRGHVALPDQPIRKSADSDRRAFSDKEKATMACASYMPPRPVSRSAGSLRRRHGLRSFSI